MVKLNLNKKRLGDEHDHDDHDHGDENEGEYQKGEDSPIEPDPIEPVEAIEIKGESEGGFMAVAADPEAAHKEMQNAPKLDLGKIFSVLF